MRARVCMVALAVSSGLGCDRGRPIEAPPAPPVSAPTTSTPAPASSGCTLAALPVRRPAPGRVVAIGDLHGDLAAARSALRAAGAIDQADRWIGGKLVVVQTGDVLDRGDDEQAILD